MKLAVALSVIALSTATNAVACEFDADFELAFIIHAAQAAAAGSNVSTAQLQLDMAAAQRDRHMEMTRAVFASRFGLGAGAAPTVQMAAQTVASSTTEQTSSDADRRTQAEPLYR